MSTPAQPATSAQLQFSQDSTPENTIARESDAYEPVDYPDISGIIIEDDTPVDGIYSEKQHRLLTEPLYSSWSGPPSFGGEPRPFMATTNVGLFASPHTPPLVPDVLLSADVHVHPDFTKQKRHRTYFIWEMGKPPEVVIEVVSHTPGDELGKRKRGYARMHVSCYVVWDPEKRLGGEELLTHELRGDLLVPVEPSTFSVLGLQLAPWEGAYEGTTARWLRWYVDGVLLATGAEKAIAAMQLADSEAERADLATQRADSESQRADSSEAHAKELAALLRKHGITVDSK